MSNNKGFTLIEVLISSGLILMLAGTFIPIGSLLERERTVLSDQRTIATELHDELLQFLWDDNIGTTAYSRTIDLIQVGFDFTVEKRIIKGCANWENVRNKNETICLYGYQ